MNVIKELHSYRGESRILNSMKKFHAKRGFLTKRQTELVIKNIRENKERLYKGEETRKTPSRYEKTVYIENGIKIEKYTLSKTSLSPNSKYTVRSARAKYIKGRIS